MDEKYEDLDDAFEAFNDGLHALVETAAQSGLGREEVLGSLAQGLYLLATMGEQEPKEGHVHVVSVVQMGACACHLLIEVGVRPKGAEERHHDVH
jgi:small ligand-binding sensory domain FIST